MEETGIYSVKQLTRLLKRDNFGNPPECFKGGLFLKKNEKEIDDFYLYGNYQAARISGAGYYAAKNQAAAHGKTGAEDKTDKTGKTGKTIETNGFKEADDGNGALIDDTDGAGGGYGKDEGLDELDEFEDVEELEEAGEDETLSEETPKPALASSYTFEDPLKGSDLNKMAMRIEFSKPKEEDEEADIPLDISAPEMDLFSNFIKKSNFGLPTPAKPAENAEKGEKGVIGEKNGIPFIVKEKADSAENLDKGMKNLVDAVLSTGKT